MTIAQMKYTSEAGHWYDQAGKPKYTIEGKNGKERNTTLRDARAHQLVPSVTTIINVAAKPALENWKINQALLSALTLPKIEGESDDDFILRAKQDAKQQSIDAAEKGTAMHADIERGFLGVADSPAYQAVQAILDELYPGVDDWCAEYSFCSPKGYGGKVDLSSLSAKVTVDFKSKEGIKNADPAKLVYPEHGMQLSAYSEGLELRGDRVSIFVDRNDPFFAVHHVWDKESHDTHYEMFLSLLNYWKLSKGYNPEIK